jgi:hypothetical protein
MSAICSADAIATWGDVAMRLGQRLRHEGQRVPSELQALEQGCRQLAVELAERDLRTWSGAARSWKAATELPAQWTVHRVLTLTAAGLHQIAAEGNLDADVSARLEALATIATDVAKAVGPILVLPW